MSHRHQRGWLKKKESAQGETWVCCFHTSRPSDGTICDLLLLLKSRPIVA